MGQGWRRKFKEWQQIQIISSYKSTISKLTEFKRLGISFSIGLKNTACVGLYRGIALSRELITRKINSEYPR